MTAWSQATSQNDRFDQTLKLLSSRTLGSTYQGWIKATIRFSPILLRLIAKHWMTLVKNIAGVHWQTDGWTVLAVDSSKINLARTDANEKAFGKSGKNNGGPQSVMCMILHLKTGLVWCWKIGRTSSSERGMLRQMLGKLPVESLLVADAGFTGFNLWKQMNDAGQSFMIRVGANVRLLKPHCKVRPHGEVIYLWTNQAQREKVAPLILRLITVQDGKKKMYLITNVLDEKKLTDRQVAKYYQWRWGIELWFRTMKQTLNRQTMRSHAPVQAALELRWSILGVAMLGLMTAKTQIERGMDPRQLSVANAIRVIRYFMRWPTERGSAGRLVLKLSKAVTDHYVRMSDKTARHYARKKKHRTAGHPVIINATLTQMLQIQKLSGT